MQQIPLTLHGCSLTLLGGGGIYLPDHRLLLVADLHLGKEATFRNAAIPVPIGATGGTLDQLSDLIAHSDCRRVCFVGDLFHDADSLSDEVCRDVEAFLDRHRETDFSLVIGNHDEQVGRLPEEWPIADWGHRHRIDRVELSHYPADPVDDETILFCGHLHPSIKLTHGDDRFGKLPCFWMADRTVVMPAFGQFTGTATVQPRDGDRVWVVAEDALFEMPASGKRRHRRRVGKPLESVVATGSLRRAKRVQEDSVPE